MSGTAVMIPVKLALHAARQLLEIEWSDGVTALLSHQRLREACRCASCTSVARAGSPVIAPAGLSLDEIRPVGSNAVQFVFSDGHDRGIYPFPYLRELAEGRGVTSSRADAR